MKGYWGRDDATKEAIPDGWFLSGDMAKQDEDGYFFIVDRKKDLIIRGGYNVYPREVEEALYEHEGVAEVAVIGIPDDEPGRGGRRRRRAEGRQRRRRGGAAGLRQGTAGCLQVPTGRVDRGRAAQGTDRQDPAPRGQALPRRSSHERRHRSRVPDARGRRRREHRRRCTAGPAAQRCDQQPDPQVPAGDVRGSVHRQPGPAPGKGGRDGPSAWPPSWPRSASDDPSSRRTRRTAASPRRAGPRTHCSSAPCRATSRREPPCAVWSTTPSSAGATSSGWASSSTTSSRRPPRATTRS